MFGSKEEFDTSLLPGN